MKSYRKHKARRPHDEIIEGFHNLLIDLWQRNQVGLDNDPLVIKNTMEKYGVTHKFKLSLMDKYITSTSDPTKESAERLLADIRERARNSIRAFKGNHKDQEINNNPMMFLEIAEPEQPSNENLIKNIDSHSLAKELISRGYKVFRPTTQYEEITL